jgi:hypothetical protein
LDGSSQANDLASFGSGSDFTAQVLDDAGSFSTSAALALI